MQNCDNKFILHKNTVCLVLKCLPKHTALVRACPNMMEKTAISYEQIPKLKAIKMLVLKFNKTVPS